MYVILQLSALCGRYQLLHISAALLGFWPDFRSIVRSLGQNARIYDAVYTASLPFASNIEYIYRISIKTASGVHKSCLMLH